MYLCRAALRTPATVLATATLCAVAFGSEHEHSKRTAHSCAELWVGRSPQALPHAAPQRANAGTEAIAADARRVPQARLQPRQVAWRSRAVSYASPARAQLTGRP